MSDSGVTLTLEARRVMWHPDGDLLRGRSTEAFAEARDGTAPLENDHTFLLKAVPGDVGGTLEINGQVNPDWSNYP